MNNPLHTDTISGLRIIEARQIPRYVLPHEVLPGVPWPKGFLADFNDWAEQYIGRVSILPPGRMYVMDANTLVMHPFDIAKLKAIT